MGARYIFVRMSLSDLSVHVATITKKVGDKVYRSHLLRHSFREEGRVLNRTVANLSMLPDAAVEALRLALNEAAARRGTVIQAARSIKTASAEG